MDSTLEEQTIKQFITERCIKNKHFAVRVSDLHQCYVLMTNNKISIERLFEVIRYLGYKVKYRAGQNRVIGLGVPDVEKEYPYVRKDDSDDDY